MLVGISFQIQFEVFDAIVFIYTGVSIENDPAVEGIEEIGIHGAGAPEHACEPQIIGIGSVFEFNNDSTVGPC